MKKLLPKRKPERKQSEEEFALRKSKLNSDEIKSVWKTSVDLNSLASLVRVKSHLEKIAELLLNFL